MKTKIIYISGNEIFNISDIRAAFEEVRNALQLDKDTVLFGVPVDTEDAGFGNKENKTEIVTENISQPIESSVEEENVVVPQETIQIIEDSEPEITEDTIIKEPVVKETVAEENIVEEPVKKRGRPRKVHVSLDDEEKPVEPTEPETIADSQENDEKVVPILSILSSKEEEPENKPEIIEDIESETVIDLDEQEITESQEEELISDETESLDSEVPETPIIDDSEEDLEKLLSAIKPLDSMEDSDLPEPEISETSEPENIDATLEQLATEFVATQDKINEETKSSGRSKIGKLRNILPFKQSKNKDSQGLGDLFGWAGIAANDEDFSVPGFFTNAASKK
ncbi:MAG: hypothetical protein IKN73_04445 [Alphaproteobacteria bacterium]|nr:hypothetical protein [Alphaproteobacteria bacterium]